MIETFNQAVKFLENYIPSVEKKYLGELGLSRMQYLVSLLGNPQLKYPTVHVGGTSGKGSTTTIIACLLVSNYKVGLYTSPHLVKVTERIKIMSNIKMTNKKFKNNYDISDQNFIELINEMLPVIKKVEESKYGKPSYFEIVTALAFLYFKKQKVDIAVIEVGMGGRYDGTNVIEPQVAVLTNVGLDHTEVLGETIEEIAKDKMGIVKSGIEVVSGANQTSVIEIISAKCKVQSAKLSLFKRDFSCEIRRINDKGCIFDYFGEETFRDLRLSLLGRHQIENASLAIKTIEELNKRIKNNKLRMKKIINEGNMQTGLKHTFIPGRMEIVRKEPLVILDGAHNEDKAKALVAAIKQIFPKKQITTIIAIKNDKNARSMLHEFLNISHQIIFTKFQLISDQGLISSFEPEELVEITKTIREIPKRVRDDISTIEDPQKALEKAVKETGKDDLILVTGSLYLVGEIKRKLN